MIVLLIGGTGLAMMGMDEANKKELAAKEVRAKQFGFASVPELDAHEVKIEAERQAAVAIQTEEAGRKREEQVERYRAAAAEAAKAVAVEAAANAAETKRKQDEKVERDHATAVEADRKKDADCKSDLQCWGNKHGIKASFACRPFVERLAKYQFEWTDGWLESKFSRFRWKNKANGQITFVGDKIKFQNGFGAWQFATYSCDYDPIADVVLNVDATPGRLPE